MSSRERKERDSPRNDLTAETAGQSLLRLQPGDGFVDVQVVAKPGARRRQILRWEPRGLVIALRSPPSEGRANDELTSFLAELLRLPRSSITIIRGYSARLKTVRIATSNISKVAAVLLSE